jgi:acetolactate synthase-1/2/3 large subunit
MTGAQIVIKTLIEQGCDTVFGYPGGAVLNIYDELYLHSDKITHILTAHEQGAAHAADAYARVSGKVGVVMATSGPGATNLVTGIATAYLDSTPLVAITGNTPSYLLGRDSFQEVDTMGITMPITKHNYIVKNVSELADIIREAFHIAKSGRPGPVLVDIPKDIQIQECEFTPPAGAAGFSAPEPSDEEISEAAEIISSSKKPFIYCGGGVVISDAGKEIEELSRRIDSPIGFSMMGLTAVPYNNPNNLGMTGMHGRFASTKAKSEADLIIAAGVRFSDRATGNKQRYTQNAKIIHIDIDPAEINKNIPVFGLVGDVKQTLKRLLSVLEPQAHPEWHKAVESMKQEEEAIVSPPDTFNPRAIIERGSEFTDEHTIVATDVGQHQMWTAQYYKFRRPRTHLSSGGLGTMGFGMGAAIGGCIASGRQRTVLFTGDGSFGMNLTELATAVSNELPIVILVFNNGVLGMVRQWQTVFYNEHYSNSTLNRKTDFVMLAKAFGADAYRAVNLEELDAALKKAFAKRTPVLIDCIIDKDERVLPMIPPGGSIDNIIVK